MGALPSSSMPWLAILWVLRLYPLSLSVLKGASEEYHATAVQMQAKVDQVGAELSLPPPHTPKITTLKSLARSLQSRPRAQAVRTRMFHLSYPDSNPRQKQAQQASANEPALEVSTLAVFMLHHSARRSAVPRRFNEASAVLIFHGTNVC